MSGRRTFRRPDTGELKDFTPASYVNDTGTMHHGRDVAEVHFLRADDGDRIDRKPDGGYQDKWGVVWEPVEATE